MRVAIEQPMYLPWIGYFDLIQRCDTFVFLDNVQFEKQSWQQRNRIKTSNGVIWITVPVLLKHRSSQKILEVEINNNDKNWRKKHWEAIKYNYIKAMYFHKYASFFKETYENKWDLLVDLNIHFVKYLSRLFGIKTEFVRASELSVEGIKNELLLDICKKIGATEYVSTLSANIYIEPELFEKENIKLKYVDYRGNEQYDNSADIEKFIHPVYNQLYGEFIPQLSIVDILMNEGERSAELIWKRGCQSKNGF